MTIDFAEWTDAQLEAGERFADRSVHGTALRAELVRRRESGVDDGSKARMAEMQGLCQCCGGAGVIGRAYPPAYGYRTLPWTRGWQRIPTQCRICSGSGNRP